MQGDDPNIILESSRMINKRLKNDNIGKFLVLFIQMTITLLHLPTLYKMFIMLFD